MEHLEFTEINVDVPAPGRRQFLKNTVGGLGVLAFATGAGVAMLSPRIAHARGLNYKVLSNHEVKTLEALGEVMAPGAREAGVANFIDQQLSIPPDDALLVIRGFDVNPPYISFYQSGLQGLDKLSQTLHKSDFQGLNGDLAAELVMSLSSATAPPTAWQGPPAHVFYHCLRNDAIDVVYGTVDGFEKLGIPYLEHIIPPKRW